MGNRIKHFHRFCSQLKKKTSFQEDAETPLAAMNAGHFSFAHAHLLRLKILVSQKEGAENAIFVWLSNTRITPNMVVLLPVIIRRG